MSNDKEMEKELEKGIDIDAETLKTDCFPIETCETIEGNVTKPIQIGKNIKVCEIKADIEVNRRKTVRLWGQVKDCNGIPVRCALVKLVREITLGKYSRYIGIAHTITDCLGFYQFEIGIPEGDEKPKYRVIAGKAATGKEIEIKDLECDPCKDSCPYVK